MTIEKPFKYIRGYFFTPKELEILKELLPENKEPEKLISVFEKSVESDDFSGVDGFLDSRSNGGESLVKARLELNNQSMMSLIRRKIDSKLPK